MRARRLFLPIELSRREYLARVSLAVYAASKGYEVIIGQSSVVLEFAAMVNGGGILFNKSVVPSKGEGAYDNLRKNNVAVVVQDEEAGILAKNYDDFFKIRTSLQHLRVVDRFFCWGQDEYNFLVEQFPSLKNRISLTGSPRTSVWGDFSRVFFRKEIEQIAEQYHDYILICTNFSGGNSIDPEFLKQAESIFPGARKSYERDLKNIDLFCSLITELSSATDRNIVIRPHPGECTSFWESKFGHYKNVSVQDDGDVTPWILAASAVIHNSCTTGVQAFFEGKMVYAFGDINSLSGGAHIVPNLLSEQIEATDESIKMFARSLSRSEGLFTDAAPKTAADNEKDLLFSKKILARPVSEVFDDMLHAIEELEVCPEAPANCVRDFLWLARFGYSPVIKGAFGRAEAKGRKQQILNSKFKLLVKEQLEADLLKSFKAMGGDKNVLSKLSVKVYGGRVAVVTQHRRSSVRRSNRD